MFVSVKKPMHGYDDQSITVLIRYRFFGVIIDNPVQTILCFFNTLTVLFDSFWHISPFSNECGFVLSTVYGEYNKGYIEVHHTNSLFENQEEITPYPKEVLICLRSCYHRMIHHFKNSALALDELKQIFEETAK